MRRRKLHVKRCKTGIWKERERGKKGEILIDVDRERNWFLRTDTWLEILKEFEEAFGERGD